MTKYVVKRQERWDQLVLVDAESHEQARHLAAEGYGEIDSDPEYIGNLDKADWEVKEVEE